MANMLGALVLQRKLEISVTASATADCGAAAGQKTLVANVTKFARLPTWIFSCW
jgi:hypothetical protein